MVNEEDVVGEGEDVGEVDEVGVVEEMVNDQVLPHCQSVALSLAATFQ